jgi:hypothetical protein
MFVGKTAGVDVEGRHCCTQNAGNSRKPGSIMDGAVLYLGISSSAFRNVCGACQALVFLTMCDFWVSYFIWPKHCQAWEMILPSVGMEIGLLPGISLGVAGFLYLKFFNEVGGYW